MRYQAITTQVINFSKVPNKNPTNDPHAAFKAWLELLLEMTSPTKAPTKGPIIIPKGPIQKPAINHRVHPQIPYLVPPNLRVP